MLMPPANWTPSRGATALATQRWPAISTNQVWEPMPPLWTVTWVPIPRRPPMRDFARKGLVMHRRASVNER
jgi:hypothetical protein